MKAPMSQRALKMLNDPKKVGKLMHEIDTVRAAQRKAMDSDSDEKPVADYATTVQRSSQK